MSTKGFPGRGGSALKRHEKIHIADLKPLYVFVPGSVLDAEGAHAAVEVAAVHAHQFSGARDVAVGFFELSLNKFAMIGLGGFFKGREPERRRRRFFFALRRQIVRRNFRPGCMITTRSIVFRSSRTLPGHEYDCIASIASGRNCFRFLPYAFEKC